MNDTPSPENGTQAAGGAWRPRLKKLFRLQWEPAQDAHVLLYPEGMVKLNPSAAQILLHGLSTAGGEPPPWQRDVERIHQSARGIYRLVREQLVAEIYQLCTEEKTTNLNENAMKPNNGAVCLALMLLTAVKPGITNHQTAETRFPGFVGTQPSTPTPKLRKLWPKTSQNGNSSALANFNLLARVLCCLVYWPVRASC